MDLVKDGITAMIAVAAVAGIVTFGIALDRAWIIAVLLGASAIFAAYRKGQPLAAKFLRQATEYPVLAERLRASQEYVAKLEGRENEVQALLSAAVQEGRQQVAGALLAATLDTLPTITAKTLLDGRLRLSVRREGEKPIPLNARFSLVVIGVGEVKGVLAVVEVSEDGSTAVLECVDEVVKEYWRYLRSEAERNSTPPGGVALEKYSVDRLIGLDDAPEMTRRRRRRGS